MESLITDPKDQLRFLLAGNAVFTVENPRTGGRFTFRVRKSEKGDVHFVSVLSGPSNTSDYEYLGCIFKGRDFKRTNKTRVAEDAPSMLAFKWLWHRLSGAIPLTPAILYHEGRCGRCGRVLTVPESITTGLGPECARRN